MPTNAKIVYLDNNSTTELSQDAASVVMDIVLHNYYGNPSSNHTMGIKVKTIVDAARYGVAQSLGCSSEEIVFTSGGTESNNLAIRGVSASEVIISAGEHSSVVNTVSKAIGEDRSRIIPLLPSGIIDLDWADRLISESTDLVSVMLANNITGVINPLKELVELAHSRGVLVHCDAVQAYGKIPIKVRELGVDLLSISGHKAHALPGIGALYIRKGVQVRPTITGGGQELGQRAGTENYVGIATLGTVANEITKKVGMDPGLRDSFEKGILKKIPDVIINGVEAERVPNTSSVTFKGIHAMSMVTALGDRGIIASAGSACSSGSTKPSPTLVSMGLSEEEALSTVRFSFSQMSKLSDVVQAIEACVACSKALNQK